MTSIAVTWLAVSGSRPASESIWARATKKAPNPTPARIPSSKPDAAAEPCSGATAVPGSRATSQIAGIARAIPIQTSRAGRSPRTTPTMTGSTAAPTPETGATTPIRPEERPR